MKALSCPDLANKTLCKYQIWQPNIYIYKNEKYIHGLARLATDPSQSKATQLLCKIIHFDFHPFILSNFWTNHGILKVLDPQSPEHAVTKIRGGSNVDASFQQKALKNLAWPKFKASTEATSLL